ncbi:MAG TPA: hypothetical protein VIS47_07300 [Nitrosopumilus sp.]
MKLPLAIHPQIVDILKTKNPIMGMELDSKKTLLAGLGITLAITIFGGYIINTFLIPQCKQVLC